MQNYRKFCDNETKWQDAEVVCMAKYYLANKFRKILIQINYFSLFYYSIRGVELRSYGGVMELWPYKELFSIIFQYITLAAFGIYPLKSSKWLQSDEWIPRYST